MLKPSAEQENIFTWVASGHGNALVEAVAGSGKTTTLVHALKHMKGSIAFMAYNKKAATDIQEKCEAEGLSAKAECGTVHSFGFSLLRANKVFPKVDEWARWNVLADKFGIERKHGAFFKNFLSMAKQRGIGLPGEAEIKDVFAWEDLAEQFSLWDYLPEEFTKEGVIKQCMVLLQAAKYDYKNIDFDDMIWLPLVLGFKPNSPFDWILLDEAQDTNPARRRLVTTLLKPTGRALFVGDPAQAIYGFTGADNESLAIISRSFNTQSLPLHTSFRCAKRIIDEARNYVSHINAFETNPEGEVNEYEVFEKNYSWLSQVTPVDVVLCRYTRPLIAMAFSLIRDGRAAKVEGRKIGEGLKALVKKLKFGTREEFASALRDYTDREIRELLAKKKNLSASTIQDKSESLLCVAESVVRFSKSALEEKIDAIFDDKIGPGTIKLMTIHRSKGLEWNRVFWYGPQFSPSSFAKLDWEFEQENNLCYVAITRAKSSLQIVNIMKEPR